MSRNLAGENPVQVATGLESSLAVRLVVRFHFRDPPDFKEAVSERGVSERGQVFC